MYVAALPARPPVLLDGKTRNGAAGANAARTATCRRSADAADCAGRPKALVLEMRVFAHAPRVSAQAQTGPCGINCTRAPIDPMAGLLM